MWQLWESNHCSIVHDTMNENFGNERRKRGLLDRGHDGHCEWRSNARSFRCPSSGSTHLSQVYITRRRIISNTLHASKAAQQSPIIASPCRLSDFYPQSLLEVDQLPLSGWSIITLCECVTFWLTRMLGLLQRLSAMLSPPSPHLRLLCKPCIDQGGLTAAKLVEQADKDGQMQRARCWEHEIGEWWESDGFEQIRKIDISTGLHSIYIARLLLKATSGGDEWSRWGPCCSGVLSLGYVDQQQVSESNLE